MVYNNLERMISAVDSQLDAPSRSLPQAAERSGRRVPDPLVRYCWLTVLLPLLAIPAFILLGKSDFFLHHGASVWVQANDSTFSMRHRDDCDVLVFGDSTAMTGINPAVVERETGFRTCNIAVTNAVLAVTGNLTLDRYLEQNEKPKILIVQLSPDDFQQENRVWAHTIYAEGLLELLRHGSPSESRQVLLTHPHESISFAGYAAGFSAYYALKDIWFRTTHLRPEEDTIQVPQGSTFFTPPAPARTYCDTVAKLNDRSEGRFSRSLAAEFRQRYAGAATEVLVDVAPIPSCDENLAAYRAELQGVTSNHLQDLPITFFNDGRHYTAQGSWRVSELVSQQVNELAGHDPSLQHAAPPSMSLATLRRVVWMR